MEQAEILARQISIIDAQIGILDNQYALQRDNLTKRKAAIQKQLDNLSAPAPVPPE